jgi:abortive infection Abi-like protein
MSTMPIVTAFVMYGARVAIAGGLFHIEEQVKGIERAVIENPGLAFDLAKTVVESACRTILAERKIAFEPDDDLLRLFKNVTKNLPMLPVAASSEAEARKSLVQTLNGLHTSLQGVCELRNVYGFATHGAEGPRPVMETVQALLAAQTADAIVGFLHRVHRQERNSLPNIRLEYNDNESFNAYIDEANGEVRVFDLAYRSSEVLFAVDQQAYHDLLSTYDPGSSDAEDASAAELTGEVS